MLRRLPIYLRQNVLALLALFVALGGTAYAANTVNSSDIVDGQVKSVDVGDGEIGSADVKDGSLNTFDVHSFLGVDVVDGSLTGADVQDNSLQFNDIGSQSVGSDEVVNDSLLQSDIRAGAVTGDEVLDNSLTGADINESALNLPSRARFVSVSGFDSRVAETQVPQGNYLVYFAANQRTEVNDGTGKRVTCELFNKAAGQADPGDFIGDTQTSTGRAWRPQRSTNRVLREPEHDGRSRRWSWRRDDLRAMWKGRRVQVLLHGCIRVTDRRLRVLNPTPISRGGIAAGEAAIGLGDAARCAISMRG